MPSLPSPFRAAVGLIATVAEEARTFPDRAIELPMLAVSTALQVSLRAQQRYAQLIARGDEILSSPPTTDDPPPWATFDEPVLDEVATSDEPLSSPATTADPVLPREDVAIDPDADDDIDETTSAKAKAKPMSRPRISPTGKPSAFDAVGEQ